MRVETAQELLESLLYCLRLGLRGKENRRRCSSTAIIRLWCEQGWRRWTGKFRLGCDGTSISATTLRQ